MIWEYLCALCAEKNFCWFSWLSAAILVNLFTDIGKVKYSLLMWVVVRFWSARPLWTQSLSGFFLFFRIIHVALGSWWLVGSYCLQDSIEKLYINHTANSCGWERNPRIKGFPVAALHHWNDSPPSVSSFSSAAGKNLFLNSGREIQWKLVNSPDSWVHFRLKSACSLWMHSSPLEKQDWARWN